MDSDPSFLITYQKVLISQLISIIECKHVIRECFKDHDYRPSIDVIREMVASWTVDDISELEFDTTFKMTM